MLTIIQTIASTRADHGGTSRSVPALCDALTEAGHMVHLITGVHASKDQRDIFPTGSTKLHRCVESPIFGRLTLGRQFAAVLKSISTDCALVHDHGLWLSTNHAVATQCRRQALPRIVSPRGMAGSWAMNHGRQKKQLAWLAYQKRDLQSATAFHATSQQEADEIRALGMTQPIAIIPNGLHQPTLPVRNRNDDRFRVLFMSRIHPKKGLTNLVQAWQAAQLPPQWELVLAGPNEGGYQQEVERLVSTLGLSRSIRFAGTVNDLEKWQVYVDSDLFVLPSFNENFGIVIAEAMLAGLPVITTTGTPWSAIASHQLGWWVEPDVLALTNALRTASQCTTAELSQMGKKAAEYVTNEFSWNRTATQMLKFYRYVLDSNAGTQPDLVVPDFVVPDLVV